MHEFWHLTGRAGRPERLHRQARAADGHARRLLVKVQAVDVGDTDAVRAAVEERIEWARAKLARYERQRDRLLAGRNEAEYLRDAARVGPYLTLIRGRMFEEDNIRWAESILQFLAERTAAGERH